MTYKPVLWLPDALRAEGCRVRVYQGWQTRGRPASTGDFDPYAVGLHHTGTRTSMAHPAPTVGTCIKGRSDLPGPLCHVVIGYDGLCHVIAAGRANHAGKCNGIGPLKVGDGNAQMVGFEIDYSGSQPMSEVQYAAMTKASAAVLRHFHKDASYARGHKEWSTTGKWDPGRNGANSPQYAMGPIRSSIAVRLNPPSPKPKPTPGDDMAWPETVTIPDNYEVHEIDTRDEVPTEDVLRRTYAWVYEVYKAQQEK